MERSKNVFIFVN